MANDDIEIAQQLVSGKLNKLGHKFFHDSSIIYRSSTENVSIYWNLLQNREKILSIISSGDQILNTILAGNLNIDGFDISRFPKYFLELKRAAIISLALDEYIKFFLDCSYLDDDDELYDMYIKFRGNLDQEYRYFWDSLFDFFDVYEVFGSNLFSTMQLKTHNIVEFNPYLQKDNYRKLKEQIGKVNLNYYQGDIKTLKLPNKYDLINLSNIINYETNYKDILEKLPLKDGGIALTYLYFLSDTIRENFRDCIFETPQKVDNGHIMIYRK